MMVFQMSPRRAIFFELPSSANDMKYAHRISKSKWTKAILKEKMGETSNPSTEGDIVFYLHGFNNSQATVLKRHCKIKKGLEKQGFDGAVVSFDWPSADSALNYLEDREDAKLSAFRFVRDDIETFSTFQQPDCHIDLHVLAHSMGFYVVGEAFDDADDRARIADCSWAVSQVMLMAANLPVDSLSKGNPKSLSLDRHCARLTNYSNPLEDVLSISLVKRLAVATRAGRTGMEAPEHPKGVDIYCGNRFRDGKHGSSIRAGHTWYFDDPVVMEDIYHTICGRLDRHEIPTRAFTDRGNLGLK